MSIRSKNKANKWEKNREILKDYNIYCEGQTEILFFELIKNHLRKNGLNTISLKLHPLKGKTKLEQLEIIYKKNSKNDENVIFVIDTEDEENNFNKIRSNEWKNKDFSIFYSHSTFEVWLSFLKGKKTTPKSKDESIRFFKKLINDEKKPYKNFFKALENKPKDELEEILKNALEISKSKAIKYENAHSEVGELIQKIKENK